MIKKKKKLYQSPACLCPGLPLHLQVHGSQAELYVPPDDEDDIIHKRFVSCNIKILILCQ